VQPYVGSPAGQRWYISAYYHQPSLSHNVAYALTVNGICPCCHHHDVIHNVTIRYMQPFHSMGRCIMYEGKLDQDLGGVCNVAPGADTGVYCRMRSRYICRRDTPLA
jgi:hypothetical protein